MSDENKDKISLDEIKNKVKNTKESFYGSSQEDVDDVSNITNSVSWRAVSASIEESAEISSGDNKTKSLEDIDFIGKNLENGKFSRENLDGANFSVANLSNVDFSGTSLRGVDFSGANMSGADLSGADLSGAILSGTVLKNANFTGAILNEVKLSEADIEGALLLDITIDELGIEELQALIEFLAKYYPHKLNLTRINLTLLDLSKIDLKRVNLRGVDFTGVNFTGVNISGLDLSQCKITPEQIAQALGRVPSQDEMNKLLAPKKKKSKMNDLDLEGLFFGRGKFGVIDATKGSGLDIGKLVAAGRKILRKDAPKPPVKESEALEHIRDTKEAEVKSHNMELRSAIEARKQETLAKMKQEKISKEEERTPEREPEKEVKREIEIDRSRIEYIKDARGRSRD